VTPYFGTLPGLKNYFRIKLNYSNVQYSSAEFTGVRNSMDYPKNVGGGGTEI
jgi:hypothetical protein